MSYAIHLWEDPRPATLAEAVHIAFELGEEDIGQNPGFIVLAGRLKARFPCITTLPADEGVWSDGPLDGKTSSRALVLGIRERHEEVVAFVVECAGKLGLTVFDMQTATAYLPSGAVLAQAGDAPKAAPEKWIDDLSVRDIREAVHEGLMKVLGGYGFVHDRTGEHHLMLRFPGGFHRIGVPLWDYKPVYRITFLLSTRLDEVASITAAFRGVVPESQHAHTCSLVHYGYFYGESEKEYEFDSRPGLALAVTEMNIAIVNKLLPLLDMISDVRGLEALYNAPATGVPFQLHQDGYAALTLARLAGNPAFASMCPLILGSVHVGNRDLRRNLQRLIPYLENYDPANPAPPPPYPFDENARFIADYDGSQQAELEFASNGATGPAFYDANENFRIALMRESGPMFANFSLRLLRDVFRAQAKACSAKESFDGWVLAAPACALLCRGGVGELDLFAESIPVAALSTRSMLDMPIPADMAASMRHACDERKSNPLFAERAQQYTALERFFGAIAARKL